MTRRARALRARLGSEAGYGIVEVLTAAVVVAVGLVGALTALDAGQEASRTAQRHEQAVALGQREIERLQAVPFDVLALTAPPVVVSDPSSNPDDPRAFVEDANADTFGDSFRILVNYHDRASGPPAGMDTDLEPLIVDPAGAVTPITPGVPLGPTSTTGEVETATVHRFVTQRDEDCEVVGLGAADLCPAEQGSKRITVAVTLEDLPGGPGPNKPVYVSSVVTDPDATPVDLPL